MRRVLLASSALIGVTAAGAASAQVVIVAPAEGGTITAASAAGSGVQDSTNAIPVTSGGIVLTLVDAQRPIAINGVTITNETGASGADALRLVSTAATVSGRLNGSNLLTTSVDGGAALSIASTANSYNYFNDAGSIFTGSYGIRVAPNGGGTLDARGDLGQGSFDQTIIGNGTAVTGVDVTAGGGFSVFLAGSTIQGFATGINVDAGVTSVEMTGGSIEATTNGIFAIANAGAVTVTSLATITALNGIYASAANGVAITTSGAGTINTRINAIGAGISALSSSGTGAVTIDSGQAIGNTLAGYYGIDARTTGTSTGAIAVTSTASIHGTDRGISAVSVGGATTINASGAILSGTNGIFASGANGTTITTSAGGTINSEAAGTGTGINATGSGMTQITQGAAIGTTTTLNRGINVTASGAGTVNVASNAAITTTGTSSRGIVVTTAGGASTVTTSAAISTPGTAVSVTTGGGVSSVTIGAAIAIAGTLGFGVEAYQVGAASVVDVNANITGGNRAISAEGTINVAAGVAVSADAFAVDLTSTGTLNNLGSLTANYRAAAFSGTLNNFLGGTITSTGSYGADSAAVFIQSNGTLSNDGTITGANGPADGIRSAAQATITNTGSIIGTRAVYHDSGNSLALNNTAGTITGRQDGVIIQGGGRLVLTNTGTIQTTGGIGGGGASGIYVNSANGTAHSISSSGAIIGGNFAVAIDSGALNLVNQSGGTIAGGVNALLLSTSGATNITLDDGSTVTGAIFSEDTGTRTLIVNGALAGNYVGGTGTGVVAFTLGATGAMQGATFGSGSDTFTFQGGTISGSINAGTGTNALVSILGAGTGTLNQANLSGFETYEARSGALTLTGTGNLGWSITGGQLVVSGTILSAAGAIGAASGTQLDVGASGVINTTANGGVAIQGPSTGSFRIDNAGAIGNGTSGGNTVQAGSTALTLNNSGAITTPNFVTVLAGANSIVTNTGTITGGANTGGSGMGVQVNGIGTVNNNSGGTITAAGNYAVRFDGAGQLNNALGATIRYSGNANRSGAVVSMGAGGTVANLGTIDMTGTAGQGITLTAGGTVTNGSVSNSTALIRANPGSGMLITGAAATTVNNYGRVTGGNGIVFVDGGPGALTINNLGTGAIIDAVSFTAVLAGSGGLTLANIGQIVGSGGVVSVGAAAISNSGTIGSGAISGGVFVRGGTGNGVASIAGGAITNSGSIDAAAAGIVATGALTLVNTGTIRTSSTGSGSLDGVVLNSAAAQTILNSGTISSDIYSGIVSYGDLVLTNASGGQVTGGSDEDFGLGVQLGAAATIDNYGTIGGGGTISGIGQGADVATVINLYAGSTTGNIRTSGGNDTLALHNGQVNASAITRSYSDAVSGAAGSVTLQNAGTLAAASFGAVDLGGGTDTLQLRGSGTGAQAGSFAISTSTGAEVLTKADTGTWTLTGAAITPGMIINAGSGGAPGSAGLLIFDGTSGLAGDIFVNGATIRATSGAAFGTGTVRLIDPTIQFAATASYGNAISLEATDPGNDPSVLQTFGTGITAILSGAITQASAGQPVVFSSVDVNGLSNAGTFTLTNSANAWTGSTTISAGTTVQASTNTLSGSTVANAGTLLFAQNVDGTFAGSISGAGTVRVDAVASSVTLSGSNTNSGATSIVAGTLVASGGAAIGDTSSVSIASGATLELANNEAIGSLAGSGAARILANSLTIGGNDASTVFSGTITDRTPSVYIGSWTVSDGPAWATNPPTYTGQEAAALLFGGSAGDYRTSTSASTITDTAWYNRYGGDPNYIESAANYRVDTGGPGYNAQQDTSAYVSDHTGELRTNYAFDRGLALGGGMTKIGTGTLTLDGVNTYSGVTTVTGGTLVVNGSILSATNVANGATLRGAGTIGGAVTIADGGRLAGVQVATLTMNSLSLSSGSTIDASFNAQGGTALFAVGGDLMLDGSLDIVNSGAGMFGAGVYRLISYGGALTDNGLEIRVTPASITVGGYAVQTAMAGQVNLVALAPELLFWDGGNAALRDNGAIDGGSGTWTATAPNWTGVDGLLNGPMAPQPGFAVFQAAPGTVTIDDSAGVVGVTGMQFAVDGYRLEGDAITLANGMSLIRVGDGTAPGAGYSATIAARLTGSGGLAKDDLGTLILTGQNDYAGATAVNGGTLVLGDGTSAATILGSITLAGDVALTLRTNASIGGGIVASGAGNRVVTIAGMLGGAYDASGNSGIDTVTMVAGGSMTSANLGAGNDSFTYYGGTISGIIDGAADLDTLYADFGAGNAGTVTLANFINFEEFRLLAGEVTLTGPSASPGAAVYATSGTTSFTDTQSNTGDIFIDGGDIRANTAGAFGTGTIHFIDPTAFYGATGSYANNLSLEVQTPASADPATLSADAGVVATLTGTIIQGTGAGVDPNQPLVIAGAGTIVLTNAGNLWTGATTIETGATLQGASDTISGSSIVSNGTLAYVQPASGTVAQNISGIGRVFVSGLAAGETLTLAGTSTVSGGFTVNDGSALANTGSIAGPVALADGGSLTNSGTVSGDVTVTGLATAAIANSGTIGGTVRHGGGAALTLTSADGGTIGNGINAIVATGASIDTVFLAAGSTTNGAIGLGDGADGLTLAGASSGGVDLGAGDDRLTLVTGAAVGGMLDGGAGSDALVLTGTGTGTLDVSTLRNFDMRTKDGAGTWSLTGTDASAANWQVDAGTLALAGGTAVNAAASVNLAGPATLRLDGPAQFAALTGTGTLALGAGRLTLLGNGDTAFGGAITGSGSLDKQGSGRLTLAGSYAMTGRIDVTAGTLAFAGSSQGGMRVQGGTLIGQGSLAGNLALVSGTVSPGGLAGAGNALQPIGSLSAQSLTVSGGALRFDVGGANFAFAADSIRVTGPAVLSGGTVAINALSATSQYGFEQAYTIVTAGSLTGTFANGTAFAVVANDPVLKWRLRYDLVPNAVVLQVQKQLDFAASVVGGTANQQAVGAALNGSAGLASDQWSASLNAIAQVPTAQRGAAYDSLSGEVLANTSTATIMANTLFLDLLRERSGDDALGGSGFAGVSSSQVQVASPRSSTLASRLATQTPGGGAGSSGGVWGQGYGGIQQLDGRRGQGDLETTATGAAMGADIQRGALRFGVAGGYTEVNADATIAANGRNATLDGRLVQAGGYASFDQGGLFASLAGNYYWGRFDSARVISIGSANDPASARIRNEGYAIGATAGYRADLGGGLRAEAVASATRTHDRRDCFAERAVGGLGLTAADDVREVFTATGEVRLGQWLQVGSGHALPYVTLGVRYNGGDLATLANVRFTGAPAGLGAFQVEGARMSQVLGTVGTGVDVRASDRVSLGLAAEHARGSRTSETRASLRLRFGF
jgi:autotransporter-associated beta strand protein